MVDNVYSGGVGRSARRTRARWDYDESRLRRTSRKARCRGPGAATRRGGGPSWLLGGGSASKSQDSAAVGAADPRRGWR